MTKPIRTTTPGGEPIVILTANEYERLRAAEEDAKDAAIASRAMAEYRADKSIALTSAEMRQLLAAPTPVAFWRRKRGLTQAELAAAVGISQGYLAQIETGVRTGEAALYLKLARALRLS